VTGGAPDPVLRVLRTAELPDELAQRLRALCDAAFAGDPDGEFDDEDWDHALGGVHVVVLDGAASRTGGDAVPLAHAAVVPRVLRCAGRPLHTGYVEAVAVAADQRGRGLGTAVMSAAGELVRAGYELGCLGTGAHHFYERLGWRRWRGPTWAARPDGTLRRTADDDEGVMVLLTPATADLDTGADLVCDDRAGDAW
jgi:aminoglycoside 2'-N-acetyltransferase I